jgi:tetratricopeptide (TPR) repeat protein
MRRCVALLVMVASVAASEDYERLLAEARRVLGDESMPVVARLDAQYEKLAQAALDYPQRWEAFFDRGENRCNRAFFFRAEVDAFLSRARAKGIGDAELRRARQEAEEQIERWRLEAYREFSVAEAAMARRGETQPERLLFANAAMKLAGREYLKARHGQRGAIDDFEELVQRGFQPERCADHIALCYLDVGHDHYMHDRFEDAQRAWDEGLKWTRQPRLQQMLWTNKAGAYETDHQYALAEGVLYRQIERDPQDPAHHKNLGLVLGFQNRLKEALYHYDRARELCRSSKDTRLALSNGNAWLRPAVIHGTLLENEGDARLAWRLFLEYRQLFGDDYNLSLWFGDFALSHGAYDLAWRYLGHARDLQPRCAPAYQKLVQVAPRTTGTREEVDVRAKAAAQELFDAQARYFTTDESPAVLKNCGGIADLTDLGPGAGRREFLDPDPLAGLDSDRPPPWVEQAARARDPFVPFDPGAAPEAPSEPGPAAPRKTPWLLAAGGVAGLLLLLGAVVFLLLFRRGKA